MRKSPFFYLKAFFKQTTFFKKSQEKALYRTIVALS